MPVSKQTGFRVTGENFFNVTQKGKFHTNDFKGGIQTMQNETSHISILTNVFLVRRM